MSFDLLGHCVRFLSVRTDSGIESLAITTFLLRPVGIRYTLWKSSTSGAGHVYRQFQCAG
ncbi:MAG: hypothetical protein IPH41_09830 [Sulfuritalea sp.]|nr:hypothetical protein [Sulfuritalea sp.]MBP7394321.1 hypothetical protein [Zoogloea sp.]